ncbi:MAG TPA: ATP-binding protein [Stellaceae bacterium]|nr:ATP-binding protein [Stellaceae bacterium]
MRGLRGEFATQVRTQRAAFGDPLDDLLVDGASGDGRVTRLDLQVKNKLTFTSNDDEWVAVLKRAWDTFTATGFDPVVRRVGVAIGVYNARVDQHYQAVLNWAEHSSNAANFFERIAQHDYSHHDKRTFITTARAILDAHAARPLTDDEFWHFLKAFVIIHYDFESGAGSRDETNVIERLKGVLGPDKRDVAKSIWDHLVRKAGELIPAGGGATRATLVGQLTAAGFAVGPAPSFREDIRAIDRESRRALSDIKSDIQGLRLHRAGTYVEVRTALAEARFVQIDGEPGTGKSALLKELADECARHGPIFVLKDSRIQPRGWAAHAHVFGVSDDPAMLLHEFACAGEPLLFIDGIDKITDPAVQLTVNDVLKVIASDDSLAGWRILVTVREENLKHLETWLDSDVVTRLSLRTIAVRPLDTEEMVCVAQQFPRLRPLLNASGGPDVILRRPFFLNALLGLADSDGGSELPATEVELLKLWWALGGADRKDFASAQHRRNLLLLAAEAIASAPDSPVSIRDLSPETLEELKSAGVLRDMELGHSVLFTHDIYEEWALCELLRGRQVVIAELIRTTGEPDALIRPLQLLGAYALETSPTADEWAALLEATADLGLRSVWQRAVLTSCVQSTRTTLLLHKLTEHLLANEGQWLQRLLLAMVTVEVIPNPLFLNAQLTPDVEPDQRAKYANLTALPKLITWVRFLDWLMPLVPTLPASLIGHLLPVFKTWQDYCTGRGIRHCRKIGQISYGWLGEIEAARHSRNWDMAFGGVHLGRDAEKNIRALFLSSAGDVPELATIYLGAKASDKKHVHVVRSEIVKNCGQLVRFLPAPFVDFVLAAYLEEPDDSRDPFGSYSSRVFEKCGISGDSDFYPASPAQLPFLPLLRVQEEQGLRLVRELCNHSIAIWRQDKTRGTHYRQPLTPIPITLSLPWGEQTFWGDGQVYLWFRGVWGNDAVESALMALEQWALERLDGGAPFDEIFRKVIDGNDSVSALGIGASLCLSHPGASLEAAVPLITCPHLWEWEIQRVVQDASPTNTIGNWHHDRRELSAVRALNEKPHRKSDMRQLVLYFLLSGDASLVERFTENIRSFPERLPFSYEEEKGAEGHVTALREKMSVFAEQADPQNLKSAPAPDGEHTQIWIEPPSLQKEKYRAQREEHEQRNEWIAVALWADKSLKAGAVDPQISLSEAINRARAWDRPDLFDGITDSFDGITDSFDDHYRTAAVAGVAYVAAKHGEGATWTEIADWSLDVLERAASAADLDDRFMVRSAILLMHPAVFAAHGYAALVARGFEARRCQLALLSLATDPLEGVQLAVVASAKEYAETHLDFYWVLFSTMINQCVVMRDEIPNYHSTYWDHAEAERKLALLERAEAALESGELPALPPIPMPWVKGGAIRRLRHRDTDGYVENERLFLWDVGGKILPHLSLKALLSEPDRRRQTLNLVVQLLEMTFQEIVPPFAKSKRDHGSNTPFEWVFAFSAWCGRLCKELTLNEARTLILNPVWAKDSETALMMMDSLMRTFMIRALLTPADIATEHVTLWSEIAEWLFNHCEWTRNGQLDYLDREFTSCAFSLLFCAAGDLGPLICGADPGWQHLGKFLPILKRAICQFGQNETLYLAVIAFLKRGGMDLLPDPALSWLHDVAANKKGNQGFWQANGENTVELLKRLISEKGTLLTPEHRKLIIAIADILVDDGVRGAGFLQQELVRAV